MHERHWNNMEDACAFLDDERHLGHVFLAGRKWEAWDATRPDLSVPGFRFLGRFESAEEAKEAVEASVSPVYETGGDISRQLLTRGAASHLQ